MLSLERLYEKAIRNRWSQIEICIDYIFEAAESGDYCLVKEFESELDTLLQRV